MSDKIIIEDLEIHCRVGVPDDERAQPQRLLLTVEMEHDCSAAAAADDLTRTIDYGAVSRRLLTLGKDRSWKLIETLAVEIADLARTEYGAASVRVMVKKFVLPEARWVAVEVQRGESSERQIPGNWQRRTGNRF
jgi:FolB domain-containing protein